MNGPNSALDIERKSSINASPDDIGDYPLMHLATSVMRAHTSCVEPDFLVRLSTLTWTLED